MKPSREHFEVFARAFGATLEPYPAGLPNPQGIPYKYEHANALWVAWQTAHPVAPVDVAEALDALEGLESDIDGEADCTAAVRRHIDILAAKLEAAPGESERADAELWRKWFPYLSRVTKRAPMAFLKDLHDYAPRAIEAKP